MSDLGYVEAELAALPADQRAVWRRIFTALLRDLRFGHPKGQQPDPCLNFGAGFFHTTTPAVINTEFTLAHGFGRAPYLAFPVLLLDAVGSTDGTFTVTQAADENRVYLKSSAASLPCSFVVEG